MIVTDPTGGRWRVRRRWLPRWSGIGLRARLRQAKAIKDDVADEPGVLALTETPATDSLWAFFVSLLALAVLIVFLIFGIPIVLAVLDGVIVLGAAAAGLIGRVVFRRPWIVEARAGSGEIYAYEIVGWRHSAELIRDLAQDIGRGVLPKLS